MVSLLVKIFHMCFFFPRDFFFHSDFFFFFLCLDVKNEIEQGESYIYHGFFVRDNTLRVFFFPRDFLFPA
jgi:hypothetical protein